VITNIVHAAMSVYAGAIVSVAWPWDLRGRRRRVTIKRKGRRW